MKAVRTGCLAVLVACLLARNAGANSQTGPARVRLPTGTLIFGVVTELVPGEHLIILLPHGELRTYAWDAIDLVHVRGHAAIGPGAPPPDLRPWSERTAPASLSPTTPIVTDGAQGFPTSGSSEKTAGWALGARGTVLSPTGARALHGIGFGGEGTLTHWLSSDVGLYGLFEHVRFQSPLLGPSARTTMIGAGVRIASSGTTAAALLDVAAGYRVLSLYSDGWTRRGAIPLRIGAGVRLRPTASSDVDLLLHVAPHLVTYATEAPQCAAACGPPRQGPIGFVGVSLGIAFGL